ncbi:MAG TPA: hypothetical protein VEX13_04220 [Chloroflexia bacterium]|nr:hypothetical protein [Chloroflexia bacterium]
MEEKNLIVMSGKVLWHGKDKDDFFSKASELQPPWKLAVLYTGKMTEEQALAYQIWAMEWKYSGSLVRS